VDTDFNRVRLGDPHHGRKVRAMRNVVIEDVRQECPGVKTLLFSDMAPITAGQFFMVWPPGAEEVPISASIISPGDRRGITVSDVGTTTHELATMEPGMRFGIRGPFGRGFRLGEDWLWVGGGIGAGPIMAALSSIIGAGLKATVILGATKADAIILRRLGGELLEGPGSPATTPGDKAPPSEGAGSAASDVISTDHGSLHICTDDGSAGVKGLASQLAHGLIMERKSKKQGPFGGIAACGPEPMLVTLLELSGLHGLDCQFSLERHMKCGVGACDSCSIDGLQVCRDGPVFPGEILGGLKEFGRFVRAPSGRKIPLTEKKKNHPGAHGDENV
jgi:dihydroorotate dehydrogenase electron transfer subunit